MNEAQRQIALVLKASKPEKHAYQRAVLDSQTCPSSCKVDAGTWAEWAAMDSWFVTTYKLAWHFKDNDKNFNYSSFMTCAGYFS